MMKSTASGTVSVILLFLLWLCRASELERTAAAGGEPPQSLREVNAVPAPDPDQIQAIVGATLIDGRGGETVRNASVLIQGSRILEVGPKASIKVPDRAAVIAAEGLTLIPGLIDAHFHLDRDQALPNLFLKHGVTSMRDPGAWIEAYEEVISGSAPIPRLFLAGPHLDNPPPAYPTDSFIVRDAEETRLAVNRFIDAGASSIKVYFRLPLGLIKVATETAHARGIPVTAHLEIVNATDAIRAGVDGIEHVTSFGTALIPTRKAEQYRQAVIADNNARREGRYEMWSGIDLDSPRLQTLIKLIVERGVFMDPNLAVFERQSGTKGVTGTQVRAFRNMMEFVRRANRAGARIVVGSHSSVPYAERGWAYAREMELLAKGGLTPMQVITASTSKNARFFRASDRIGTIEPGKLADLILVEGDPLQDIGAMRNVKRVMLNGQWID